MKTKKHNRSHKPSPTGELVGVDVPRLVRLVWTRTTPTENGYFWYREHVQHRAVIYDVAACERFGFAQKWDGSTKDVKIMTGWWAGPIEKPDAPSLPNVKSGGNPVNEEPLKSDSGVSEGLPPMTC